MQGLRLCVVACAVALLATAPCASILAADATPQSAAKQILEATGVKGGVVVQIGCGPSASSGQAGQLTAALRANDSYVVHALDPDAKIVEAARRNIQSLGAYGPVSVEQLTGARLPYADNLINLVVSENLGAVPMDEVMRALAPLGVAYIKTGPSTGSGQAAWTKTVKPRPGDIDEWTHYLHDAGNNAVAADTRVGAPRALQWVADPLWLRSHETPSGFEAMVCGGGRAFYLLDEGLIGITDQRLPERWSLYCRDAFNGKLLWKRKVEPWGWPEWARSKFEGQDWTTITGGRTVVPDENQRRLVVDGDRLYATLGYRAPLSILDAATGKTLFTIDETNPVRQIVAADGVALVYSTAGEAEAATAQRRGKAQPDKKGEPQAAKAQPTAAAPASALIAIDGATGRRLWRKDAGAIRGLSLAIDGGRVFYFAGKSLFCLDLKTGAPRWQQEVQGAPATLVAYDGLLVMRNGNVLETRDGATGRLLWRKDKIDGGRMKTEDLFIVNGGDGGIIWPGASTVADPQATGRKLGINALAVGYDLRTGAEVKRVLAQKVISPEHHHRCYRNKATDRFMIVSMEGAEFIDLQGNDHSQNNFARGACKMGMVPCNGMLYAPPDQCFCQPGSKVLGFTAIAPAEANPALTEKDAVNLTDAQRLEKGPAYGQPPASSLRAPASSDWPTYRYNAARHGATPAVIGHTVADGWRAKLGAGLTAPVVAGGHVYAAAADTHTIHALDLASGKSVWSFVAGGRVDSSPTVHNGLLLFGCADGRVYCLRAADGALVWRFLAAPYDRRIAAFDQLESAWPVHGSVLIRDGLAYATAGRSTYLDGGIRLYALDPATGAVRHHATLSGPFPDGGKTVPRDVSFFITGANSDLLVSEGDAIFMRQKRLTPSLQEEKPEILSTKGEANVGRHVFSTAGFLDDSWYNRTYWMYSSRWPGFQLANQAPKSGQLLVVDEKNTYAVKVYHRRNVHTTMFFPGKEGYLLYADRNDNEPQIVGEEGARPPVAWLPQSDYGSSRGLRTLDSPAFGLDKMIGYTRAEPPLWTLWLPVRISAMVKAGDTLFAAGPPDEFDPKDPYAPFDGRRGAKLVAVSAADGKQLASRDLDTPPVFDGMVAAGAADGGRLLVALEDGSLACFKGGN